LFRRKLKSNVITIALLLAIFTVCLTGCGRTVVENSNGLEKDYTIDAVPFENVMGFSGHFKDSTTEEGFIVRSFFGKTDAEEDMVIAEAFGFAPEYYILDTDGDGISELLSNSTYCVDGHRELYVFRRSEKHIQVGCVNWAKADMPDLDFWGVNAVQTSYSPEENCILIEYCSNENPDGRNTIRAGFEYIDYIDWNGTYYPSVSNQE